MNSFILIFIIGFCLFLSSCSIIKETEEVMSQDTSAQISSISVDADIDETIYNTELTNVYTEKK